MTSSRDLWARSMTTARGRHLRMTMTRADPLSETSETVLYREALEAILNTRKHTAALDIAMNALGKASTGRCSLPVEHRTATGGPYQPARESSTERLEELRRKTDPWLKMPRKVVPAEQDLSSGVDKGENHV